VSTLEFINVLFQLVDAVDKRMLTYSPRERSWIWDIDEIHDECITPNVLDLLGDKMAACSSGVKVGIISRVLSLNYAQCLTPFHHLFRLRSHSKLRHVSVSEWTE
jgi:hypothetical protein